MNTNQNGTFFINLQPKRPPSSISNNSSLHQNQQSSSRISFRDAPRTFTITSNVVSRDYNKVTTIEKQQLDRILNEKSQLRDQNNDFRIKMALCETKLNQIKYDHQQQIGQLKNTHLVETRQLTLIYSRDIQTWKQQLEKLRIMSRFNQQKQIKKIRQQYEIQIQELNKKYIESKNQQLFQFDKLSNLQNQRMAKLEINYNQKLQEIKRQHSQQIQSLRDNHQRQFDFRIGQCHTEIRNLNLIIQKISQQKSQLKNQISSKQLKYQLQLGRERQKHKQTIEERQRRLRQQYNTQCNRLQEIIRAKQVQMANMVQQLKQLQNQMMLVNSQNQVVENDQQKMKQILSQKQFHMKQLTAHFQTTRKQYEDQISHMKRKHAEELSQRMYIDAEQNRQVRAKLQRQNQRLKLEYSKQVQFLNQQLRRQRGQQIQIKNKMIHSFQIQKQMIIKDYQREIQRERAKNQLLGTESTNKYEAAVKDFTGQINRIEAKHSKNIQQLKQSHSDYLKRVKQQYEYQYKKLAQQADRVRNRHANFTQLQRELKIVKQKNVELVNQLKNGQRQCQKHEKLIEESRKNIKNAQNQVLWKEDLINQLRTNIKATQKERKLQLQSKNNQIDLLKFQIKNLSSTISSQEDVKKGLMTKQQSQNALEQAQKRYILQKKCFQDKIKLLSQALRKKQEQISSERESHNNQMRAFLGRKTVRTQIPEESPRIRQKSITIQKEKLQMISKQLKKEIQQKNAEIQALRTTNKKLRQQMIDNISHFDKERAYNDQINVLRAKLKGYQQRFRIQSLSRQQRLERIKIRSQSKEHLPLKEHPSKGSSESGQELRKSPLSAAKKIRQTEQQEKDAQSKYIDSKSTFKIRLQTDSNLSKQQQAEQNNISLRTQTADSGFRTVNVPKYPYKNISARQQRETKKLLSHTSPSNFKN